MRCSKVKSIRDTLCVGRSSICHRYILLQDISYSVGTSITIFFFSLASRKMCSFTSTCRLSPIRTMSLTSICLMVSVSLSVDINLRVLFSNPYVLRILVLSFSCSSESAATNTVGIGKCFTSIWCITYCHSAKSIKPNTAE